MKVKQLLERLQYQVIQGTDETEIKELVYDSRKVSTGDVFVCIRGTKRDAHDLAAQVETMGAAVLIIEHEVEVSKDITVIQVKDTRYALSVMAAAYFGYPAEKITTIGLTGTKGKTTATYMVRSILEGVGVKTGLIGTIETIIGDAHIPSANTTPESYFVQKYFAEMVKEGCQAVVMEVSSQGLMMHRVGGILFDYGIFTNLSPDHIGPGEHKDFEDYANCKAMLFQHCKHAIFNLDDAYAKRMMKDCSGTIEGYGIEGKSVTEGVTADFTASGICLKKKQGILGIAYHLGGNCEMDVEVDVPGTFSVYNSLAAIAVCTKFTKDTDKIREALAKIRVKGRTELLPVSPDYTVMIDYAHNAMSLEQLLKAMREYRPGRIVTLFGCGGNRDRNRRFEMGEVSSKYSDLSIITSDNPRDEEPMAIIEDILTGVKKADGAYVTIPDRKEAIKYALQHAKKDDLIILAGKGHEDYQIIKGVKHHMDERELVAEVRQELGIGK